VVVVPEQTECEQDLEHAEDDGVSAVRPSASDPIRPIRVRVVALVATGMTCREMAELNDIAPATVVKWSGRERATGSPAAKPMGGKQGNMGELGVFGPASTAIGRGTLRRHRYNRSNAFGKILSAVRMPTGFLRHRQGRHGLDARVVMQRWLVPCAARRYPAPGCGFRSMSRWM
jgi:hypothetical protein